MLADLGGGVEVSSREYPDECPLFVVDCDGDKIKRGAIVEGMGNKFYYDGHVYPNPPGYIIVRAVDDDDVVAPRDYVYACLRSIGWVGCPHSVYRLKPITRAAREMLAIAKAVSK